HHAHHSLPTRRSSDLLRRARRAGRARDRRRRADAVRAQPGAPGDAEGRRRDRRGEARAVSRIETMAEIIMPKMGDAMTEGKVVGDRKSTSLNSSHIVI